MKAGYHEDTDSEIDVKDDIDALAILIYQKNLNKKLLQSLKLQSNQK